MKNKGNIQEKVYNYKTKHQEGFTQSELENLLLNYPNINMDKFDDAMRGCTCMLKDNEIIMYHCDIARAITCGIENRNLRSYEFD
jgi:hypothetical protein